ncbi:hypothetical protein CONLIGDRAFT_718464 [Coniochaeta ligniaria NRRL 30616]|uniref:Uncharacterized protein n=1 Tax=Coniochaeta ligniaria NRRL 30616 TaxID=1408157 RepID=A0A1J7ITV9_9PEZI|nr:hypothetical protein CONLIGDRAFT_718464 [Coniochaeta ligniaria NRRL 30616]
MFTYELSLLQRLLIIWLFILCGLVLAVQAAKQYADRPAAKWRLTAETKPYWYTFYVLEAFLLVQISHRVLMLNFSGALGGYEETLLDGLWMGLLALECLMVAGVAVRAALRAGQPGKKVKAQ